MGKNEEIRKHYESMDSAQIAARLISGEVSDEAIKVGTRILTERGVNPESAMSDAAAVVAATAPAISNDTSEITGKSGKVCPFCHSAEVKGYWTPSCLKCGATYSYSILERGGFIVAILAIVKGVRNSNPIALAFGVIVLIVLGIIYYSRGTFYGTWRRKP
jgi:hypothetical protein